MDEHSNEAVGAIESLSPREHGVLELLVPGLTNGEIAKVLGITERTVRFHVGRIFAKLDVSNRTEAVALYASLCSPAALAQLPRAPALFGRDEELACLLASARASSSPVIAIEGMGGVGKTALAVTVAQALRRDYPDAQIMLDLLGTTSPLPPEEAMRHVIRSLVPQGAVVDDARVPALYRSLLATRRVLLVFDNAADREQVEPLVPPERCAMIVTSRTRMALLAAITHRLEPLDEAAACELLLAHAPHASDAAAPLARLCGRLPLALGLASRTLAARPDLDPADFAERLGVARERIAYLDENEAHRGVGASLRLSYAMLGESMQRVLCELAVFGGDFDREAAAAVWQVDDRAADRRIGELGRLHLLEWNGRRGAAARYRLHDLVSLFALQHLAEDARFELEERHARHYTRVLTKSAEHYALGGDAALLALTTLDREWESVRQALRFVSKHGAVRRSVAKLAVEIVSTTKVLEIRLHAREQIALLSTSLEAARKLLDRDGESAVLVALARAHLYLSDGESARSCAEEARRIARDIDDREREAAAIGVLGSIHLTRGELERAIDRYREQLDFATTHDLPRQRAGALVMLGTAHQSRGQPQEAMRCFIEHHELARALGDRHAEAQVLGALGAVYHVLGRSSDAETCWQRQLELAREIGDRRTVGLALGNLGHVYLVKQDLDAARTCHTERLAIAHEIADRRGEAFALGNLGNIATKMGDIPEAIRLVTGCIAAAEEMGDRRLAGTAHCNLGEAHAAAGEHATAIGHFTRAVEILAEVGDRRSQVLASFSLGKSYHALGDIERALAAMEPRVAFEASVGRSDPAVREEVEALRREHAAAKRAACVEDSDPSGG